MYIYIWNIGEIINSDMFWLFSLRLGGGWTRGTAHTKELYLRIAHFSPAAGAGGAMKLG